MFRIAQDNTIDFTKLIFEIKPIIRNPKKKMTGAKRIVAQYIFMDEDQLQVYTMRLIKICDSFSATGSFNTTEDDLINLRKLDTKMRTHDGYYYIDDNYFLQDLMDRLYCVNKEDYDFPMKYLPELEKRIYNNIDSLMKALEVMKARVPSHAETY